MYVLHLSISSLANSTSHSRMPCASHISRYSLSFESCIHRASSSAPYPALQPSASHIEEQTSNLEEQVTTCAVAAPALRRRGRKHVVAARERSADGFHGESLLLGDQQQRLLKEFTAGILI